MLSITKLSGFRKIWNLFTPLEQYKAILLLGLMFIGTILEAISIGIVIPAFTLLTKNDFLINYPTLQPAIKFLGNPNQKDIIIIGMLSLVLVYLIKTLFLTLLIRQSIRFVFSVQTGISQRLFTVYLHQPYTFHLQRNSAQLISNIVNEINLFTFGVNLPCFMLLYESFVLLGLYSILFFIEPLGSLIITCSLGMAAYGFHRITHTHIVRWGEARQYHDALRIQHLQHGLSGAKIVKLFGRENDFLEQYRTHNEQSARMAQLQITMEKLPRLWLELLAVSGLAILVISMLLQGRSVEVIVSIVCLFVVSSFRLIPLVTRLLNAIQTLYFNIPVINTLHKEFKLAPAKNNVDTFSSVTLFSRTLELSQISYVYPEASKITINDISLTINFGETVGIIGTSGVGKTTLIDILLGLLTPNTGTVWVDGKDIQTNIRNWQNQIGYVPQSIFLTDDTLRHNIAFGLPNDQINDASVETAIQAAQLQELVAKLPNGLDTFVGERGIRLSGGELQRIGIARALYHNPSVLVLDEPTSSIDISTERDLMDAVNTLHGRKTILIVTHRLTTLKYCDRFYRLEQGQIVEEGTIKTTVRSQGIHA